LQRKWLIQEALPVVLFTAVGLLAMGYHPGAEDDGVYLPSIKADLNPGLFPHDAAFFKLQMRTSVFDTWMAHFVHWTAMPVAWSALLWQTLSILLFVWASWKIVCQLFDEPAARWGGVAMLAAMFTLPVAGTAIFIMDQYLHPRNLADAFILFGVSRILAGKWWQAVPLAVLAFMLHPLMGAFGLSFCAFLSGVSSGWVREKVGSVFVQLAPENEATAAGLIPFGWIFDPPSRTWLRALRSRHWFRFYEWKWYELLGAFAPLALFGLLIRVARQQGREKLARFATAVFIYAAFQQAIAVVILGPRDLVALSTLEPMRYLQLVYVFMALIGGAYLGLYVLKARVWRWAVFLLLANGSMFYVQRQLFAATPHIEWPSAAPSNEWLQAFSWIQKNTPTDAYFALDPMYMAAPGEDYHSFRALAERSQLADGIKDTSVVTKVPEIGPTWETQLDAQSGWPNFQLADFERLKQRFGVDWVLVHYPHPPAGLECRWHNAALAVCQIPPVQ
jgi:hypothetical protein